MTGQYRPASSPSRVSRGAKIETVRPAPHVDELDAEEAERPTAASAVAGAFSRGWVFIRIRLPRLALAALLTAVSWPVGPLAVTPGIDSSWGAALHMAAHDGQVFGRELVFTYGPLGFLVDARLYYSDTWALAVVAHLIAGLLLAYSLLRLLERGMGLLLAAFVAAPLMLILSRLLLVGSPLLPEVLVLVVMLWAFDVVVTADERVSTARTLLAAAATAAVTSMKLDAGIACLLFAGCALTIAGSRRGGLRTGVMALLRFVGSTAGALAIFWLAAGQPIDALPDWLRRSVDVVRGYGAAMNIENGQRWEYTVAFLLIGTIAVLIARAPFPGRTERWTAIGLFAVVAFIAFKQGFVRHDAHVVQFFAVFAVLPVAFIRTWGAKTMLVVMIGPFVALCAIGNVDLSSLVDPGPRLDSMGDIAHLVRSGEARREYIDATRAQLRAEYGVPPAMLDRMRGRRAAVEPWELLVGYAYPDVRWEELPVFQTYNAYTTSLDQLNADALTGPGRPRFVLRQPGASIDGRVPRFESPAATLAMLCHYRTVLTDPHWQLLEVSGDRCGAPTPIARRHARFGATLRVPAALNRSIVVARFHGIADSAVDELRTLAYRARQVDIQVDSGASRRFLQGHQDAFHVLTAPACAREELDGTTAQPFERFAITADSTLGGEHYEVEFFRIPFTC